MKLMKSEGTGGSGGAGKTGSQLVQEAKDRAYWETRGMNTTEFARDSIREVLPESAIKRDLEAVLNADDSKLTQKEKAQLTRKIVELTDIVAPNPYADALAFVSTIGDIEKSEVSRLRKIGAHAVNVLGIAGAVPWIGPLVDAGAYEVLGLLLTSPDNSTQSP